VRNDTPKPLTFLQVFTTENNGIEPYNGSSNWWKSWNKDIPVLLESGRILESGAYFPSSPDAYGYNGWFNSTKSSPGTRWFITYSHGDDCFSTTFYNDSGYYPNHTNLCDYTQDDIDNLHWRLTLLSIKDNDVNVYYPSLNHCNLKMYPVDLKYCKN